MINIELLFVSYVSLSLNADLKKIEEEHSLGGRWSNMCSEFLEALQLLEFNQKAALIRKLKHDVAEYLFMQETMGRHDSKLKVQKIYLLTRLILFWIESL